MPVHTANYYLRRARERRHQADTQGPQLPTRKGRGLKAAAPKGRARSRADVVGVDVLGHPDPDQELDRLSDRGNGPFDHQVMVKGLVYVRELSGGGVPGTYPAMTVICPYAGLITSKAVAFRFKDLAETLGLLRTLLVPLVPDPRPPGKWTAASLGDPEFTRRCLRAACAQAQVVVAAWHQPGVELPPATLEYVYDLVATPAVTKVVYSLASGDDRPGPSWPPPDQTLDLVPLATLLTSPSPPSRP